MKPFLFKDLTTGKIASASIVWNNTGLGESWVQIAGVNMSPVDFADFFEYFLMSRDLRGATDLLRVKQKDIAELQLSEGRCSSNTERFRPATRRTLAGTRAADY